MTTTQTTAGRRAVLHIGTEKTGTTSLQQTLADSRETLKAAGFLFPRTAGPINHTRLVGASLDDGVVDNIKGHQLASGGVDETGLRTKFARSFERELDDSDWHTLLLSSELVHSRLHTPSEIDRLLSWFRDRVERIDVLVVLRRQDKLAVSRFSSAVRESYVSVDDVFANTLRRAYQRLPAGRVINDVMHYFDYAQLIDRFASIDPKLSVHARLYEDSGRKIDPVAEIATLGGIPSSLLTRGAKPLNTAMSATALHIVAALNREFPPRLPDGRRNEPFREVKAMVEAEVPGRPLLPPRSAATAFLEQFADANAEVCRRYFPDRPALFDNDLSIYPDTVDYSDVAAEAEKLMPLYRERVRERLAQPVAAPSLVPPWLGRPLDRMRQLVWPR